MYRSVSIIFATGVVLLLVLALSSLLNLSVNIVHLTATVGITIFSVTAAANAKHIRLKFGGNKNKYQLNADINMETLSDDE